MQLRAGGFTKHFFGVHIVANTVKGVIHNIGETQSIGQKGFRKRLVALEQDNGRYTNYVPIEFTSDDCDLVDDLNVGDEVEITFHINGRKWQKDPAAPVQYFCALQAQKWVVLMSVGVSDGSEPMEANPEDEQPF